VVPEKQGLKRQPIDVSRENFGTRISGGSRKTRIETSFKDSFYHPRFKYKWWFQKNKD